MTNTVVATVGDGKTLQQFSDLIELRSKYLKESSKDSVAACAIDVLRSIRTSTKVANPKRIKTKLQQVTDLHPSFYKEGGKAKRCLRNAGNVKYCFKQNEKLVVSDPTMFKNHSVFRFVDNNRGDEKIMTYLIVAQSQSIAENVARRIVEKRIQNYQGLARRALTLLMKKTATINVQDQVNAKTNQKADENTVKVETVIQSDDNGWYELCLEDKLNYSIDALRGGEGSIKLALMKAMNKVTSVINYKCRNILDFKKLDTPFPEIKKRKS